MFCAISAKVADPDDPVVFLILHTLTSDVFFCHKESGNGTQAIAAIALTSLPPDLLLWIRHALTGC